MPLWLVFALCFKQDSNDIEGWQRLLPAYMVPGKRASANTPPGGVRGALTSDPDKPRCVEGMIENLGLES